MQVMSIPCMVTVDCGLIRADLHSPQLTYKTPLLLKDTFAEIENQKHCTLRYVTTACLSNLLYSRKDRSDSLAVKEFGFRVKDRSIVPWL